MRVRPDLASAHCVSGAPGHRRLGAVFSVHGDAVGAQSGSFEAVYCRHDWPGCCHVWGVGPGSGRPVGKLHELEMGFLDQACLFVVWLNAELTADMCIVVPLGRHRWPRSSSAGRIGDTSRIMKGTRGNNWTGLERSSPLPPPFWLSFLSRTRGKHPGPRPTATAGARPSSLHPLSWASYAGGP